MKKIKFFSIGLCFALVLAGCNNTQKGAAIGAGGGAVLGAIVGKLAGNTAVGAAVGAAVGTGAGAIIGKKMDKAKAEAEAVQNAKVESVTDANGLAAVKVTFDSGILFATNKADLNIDAKNSLAKFATVLNNNADCDIAIIGHTDNTGSDAINQPLSVKRATSVSDYLKSCGVKTAQIKSVEGQGSGNPVADNSTAEGRKQNRRVEVYMYASQEMIQAAQAQAK
ncbi:MAG: OmpA family protein [Prevotellaceae bacterium]|nr:OmpA family protein [Prevotella sp.]MDD6803309.1 OmpA family protein [Prevotellaceae bacterium]MDD7028115.1 OmpA family protein [Prevotellaceae bacterium]MDY3252076.1 OmpA family protein [Prevotella sp.]MDY5208976.1 OmpA family protein [Prevotella sp.]